MILLSSQKVKDQCYYLSYTHKKNLFYSFHDTIGCRTNICFCAVCSPLLGFFTHSLSLITTSLLLYLSYFTLALFCVPHFGKNEWSRQIFMYSCTICMYSLYSLLSLNPITKKVQVWFNCLAFLLGSLYSTRSTNF